MKRFLAILLTGVVALSMLTGCTSSDKSEGEKAAETLVLTVGDEEVYLNEMNFYARGLYGSMDLSNYSGLDDKFSADYATLDDALKAQVLLQIRQTKILYIKAKEKGITLTDKELENMENNVTQYIATNDEAVLASYGIDRELLEKTYTEYAIISKMEEQMKEEYSTHADSYGTYESLIFLKVKLDEDGNPIKAEDGGFTYLNETELAELKAKAEEAHTKALEGEDFDTLIEEYGLEMTSGENHVASEELKKNYGLKDGEISDVIESDAGFMIVKIVALEDEEYSASANEYMNSTEAEESLSQQEQAWFDEFVINDDDLVQKVWDTFTFAPFEQEAKEEA